MSGAVVVAGGLMIFYSVQGLRKLHRTRRAKLAPARSLPRRDASRRRSGGVE